MTPAQRALLTPDEVATLDVCEAATKGPWIEGAFYIFTGPDENTFPIVSLPFKPRNGRFVARARSALPVALETIADLRAELARLKSTPAKETE